MVMQLYTPVIWLFIFAAAIKLHKAVGTKLLLYSCIGAIPLSFGYILEYVFKVDWTFATSLLWLIIIDFVTAIIYHIKEGTFDSKKMLKGLLKFFIYWLILKAAYVVSHYRVEGENDSNPFTKWPYYIYALIAGKELYSILMHMRKLGFNVLPKPIMDGLSKFLKTGNPKDIFSGNEPPKGPDSNSNQTPQ